MLFNKNLSAIHAYLCADGYVIKNPPTQKHKYYYIGLRNTNLVLLKDFQQKFEEEFDLKPILVKNERCKIQNKEIYYFLTKNYSYYSKNWNFPKLSKNNLRYWLRAYFDCDGWVFCEARKNRQIGLESINLDGLKQIKSALRRFNINSTFKTRKNRNIFRLMIYGKENLIRFQREINFLHPKKKERLELAINSYVDYEWHFPKDKRELINFVLKKAKISQKRIRFNSIIKENLEKLSKILTENFEIESKVYGPWVNGLGNKYHQLTIHKKEEINKFLTILNILGKARARQSGNGRYCL